MSRGLSPQELNEAWIQGLIDTYFIDPFNNKIPTCPYEKDSDSAEMWHLGSQWTMKAEGVDLRWTGESEKPDPNFNLEREVEALSKNLHENKFRLDS
jgi:hypothetical protein